MRRKVAAVWVSLLIMISSIVILVEIADRVEAPTTLYVGGGGPGNYSKIQWAIDNASDGDTVFVYNGTYIENIVVDKSIDVIGVNRNNTIINANGSGDVVRISAEWVNISGFTITGCGSTTWDVGIELENDQNCTIAGNNVSNNRIGIYLSYSDRIKIIDNYIFSNSIDGITLEYSNFNIISHNNASINNVFGIEIRRSSRNIISNNIVSLNGQNGIEVFGSSSDCTHNYIANNSAFSNIWDGFRVSGPENIITNNVAYSNQMRGIILSGNGNNYVANNSFYSNRYFGIYIYNTQNNNIINNTASYNGHHGIYMAETNGNFIENNTFLKNNIHGINLSYSSNSNTIISNIIVKNDVGAFVNLSNNNIIYHNNFIENRNQAFDYGTNMWDNSYPSGGNYWSDYTGIDVFSGPNQDIPGYDRIGDTPYLDIKGDSASVDRYPFMHPLRNCMFLYKEWNLISIPFIQSDTDLDSVLSSINGSYDAVQLYNTSDISDYWRHYHVSKPDNLSDLTNIEHSISFWIHITESDGVLFEYPGTQPTSNQTIQLYKGWNMVGYPSLSTHNRTVGLNNLTFNTHVDAIQWFNAAAKTWHFMDPDDSFVPGRGYWVHSKVDAEWEVPI